jgi:hypothetical protein
MAAALTLSMRQILFIVIGWKTLFTLLYCVARSAAVAPSPSGNLKVKLVVKCIIFAENFGE